MAKEKIQMVDDDEVENVGIMAGFMDDFEDVLEEMMGEEAEMEEGDDADMANMMNRRPDSPEILMNNLRGDIRSLDARREELADLVGYNAASETPEGVLALLQPILAQQQAAAAMPPMAQPPVAPPGPSPAGSSMPPVDAAGGIASLPIDQGPMSPPIMDQGPAPMAMANGGMVQYFKNGNGEPQGSDPGGVTFADGSYSPDIVETANAAIRSRLAQQPAALPDVAARTEELYPEYERLLGGGGKDAAQAQILFDIAQAALGYAGNVGPGGQPLRGSQAARLAGAVSQLPSKIGATAAGMSKEARTLKLAALQRAEQERAAVQEANLALAEQQADILKDIGTLSPRTGQPLTEADKASFGITGSQYAELPWVFNEKGIPTIAGGQPAAGTTVNVGGSEIKLTPGQEAVDKKFGEQVFEWMSGGGQDMTGQIAQLGAVAQQLEDIEAGTSDKDLTGVAVALTPEFVRAFTNPDSVDAREQVEEVVQRNLRLILGAQFTEKEGERLIARAYNFRLGEGRNAARVRRLLLQMSTAAQQKQAMVDYFNENGTLAGYVGKMPTIVDFQNAIDGAEGFTSADLLGNAARGLDIINEGDSNG